VQDCCLHACTHGGARVSIVVLLLLSKRCRQRKISRSCREIKGEIIGLKKETRDAITVPQLGLHTLS
jgi:hypothetical protein